MCDAGFAYLKLTVTVNVFSSITDSSTFILIEQALPPTLHTQKKWESSPDFKLARGGGGNPRGGWGTPRGSGPRSGMGSPSYAGGSPGRWDLAKAIQPFLGLKSTGAEEVAVGSPFQQPQVNNALEKAFIGLINMYISRVDNLKSTAISCLFMLLSTVCGLKRT